MTIQSYQKTKQNSYFEASGRVLDLDKYRKLHLILKDTNQKLLVYSQESFNSIMDYLNEDKFIMLFELENNLYLPCAINTADIIAISRVED